MAFCVIFGIMKKLGQGYFYNVYDKGNGRVIKRVKSRMDRFFTITRLCLGVPHLIWEEFSRSEKERAGFESLYKEFQENIKDTSVLGNVSFINETDYEQDKVTVLGDALEAANLETQKELIDSLMECIFTCWSLGFSERIFNFSINNGVSADGKVILIDFNEISFEKSEALKRIHNNRWERAASYKRWGYSDELKAYYESAMRNTMTEDNFNKYWISKK